MKNITEELRKSGDILVLDTLLIEECRVNEEYDASSIHYVDSEIKATNDTSYLREFIQDRIESLILYGDQQMYRVYAGGIDEVYWASESVIGKTLDEAEVSKEDFDHRQMEAISYFKDTMKRALDEWERLAVEQLKEK